MSELKGTIFALIKEFLILQMKEFNGSVRPLAKANLLKVYVTGIRFVWWSAMWAAGFVALLAIFLAGLIGLHVGVLGGFPIPESYRGACFVALVIGDFTFVAVMMSWLFSQGRWMQCFGAQRMIDDLARECKRK